MDTLCSRSIFCLHPSPHPYSHHLSGMHSQVPCTVIVDGASGLLMRRGEVDVVLVGCDRVAANGDVANKIGTYNLALAARAHGIPFYVLAPSSTFDLSLATGDEIPIEQRDPDEVRRFQGAQSAPLDVNVANPAFDVTPADLVTAIICEKGILRPDYATSIGEMIG